MTKDEALAMDLALEALKLSSVTVDSFGVQRKIQEAITALKKVRALDKMAENARELGLDYEPVAPVQEDWGPGPHECHSLPSQPASVQEPVAWRVKWPAIGGGHKWIMADKPLMEKEGFVNQALYTTPPAAQRKWVGLTDDDFKRMMSDIYRIEIGDGDYYDDILLFRAVEAKLKELNT